MALRRPLAAAVMAVCVALACCFCDLTCELQAGTKRDTPGPGALPEGYRLGEMDEALAREWLAGWEKNIISRARNRYCDRAMGEEIGWLVAPFLDGFYYGYTATRDPKWAEMEIDWADSLIKRGVKAPDGHIGWPKTVEGSHMDSLLGEAMVLRPIVLMAGEILTTPTLKEKHGRKAEEYIRLAERVFRKWNSRGCWREVKDGGLWVVPPFGIDQATGKWTDGYERRNSDGFSNPANKQNHIARWMLAMYGVTKKPIYKQRAEQWWRLMKSRMRLHGDGRYYIWNYWDPAGRWDYKPGGAPKHWVGVHPNGGYYLIDVSGIVTAYEHGLVFTKEDIARLTATNRDLMWNRQVQGAEFQRIDRGKPDKRWLKTPGVLWAPLVPYDEALRRVFEANHSPASWGGLSTTPWYLSLHARNREKAE